MKKLIHNILVVMLVVVMVMMSFGNQSVLPISIVNANESEIVYPFGYKSSNLFVADAILGQANGLDFTNISSMPILHNYTYKTLAEGIIDNKWLLGGSVVWKNAEACLNHDFIGLVTWRQIMYETLIMDWLTYQFESDEFKSEISKSSASYGWAISNYLIKDDIKIPSKVDANTIKVFDNEFYKSIGMLEKADQINEIISGINDVYTNSKDFYKQVSNILATQSACESRISFLREVQDVTNNQSLSNAIDTVIDKLYMSAGRLSFTEGSFVMAKQLANVTWDLLIAPYEKSIPLLRELKLGKAGIDWMFNTSNENSKKIELTFIYMMNADFTKAYQILRDNYKDDKSEKNALIYNNAYLDYTVYQAYSSMITEEYIAEKMLNGALNEIVNIFSDYNIQSYNDLKKMLDDDIKVSQGYYNLVGKYYSTYETVFKKNEYMSWYYDNVVHPTGVYFKRKEVEIGLQDDTFYFYDDVTVTPDNVTDGSVKYTSSDESVVTVKDKQVLSIEVHKVGSAIITVTTNDGNYQDTLKINVVEGHGKDGFYLENGSKEPNIGDTFSIGELKYEIIKKGEVYVKNAADDVTDVNIPKYVSYKGYSYKVTSIEESAFKRCYSLASVTIPNSVTSIGDWAFYDCTSLTSITIPNSVTSIGYCAFCDCTSLTNITIPNGVTSIGVQTFGYCRSLTNITIPGSVTSIGAGAFGYCTSLTNITIPDSVTSIGDGAFEDCESLTSITIPNSVTSIESQAFFDCKSLTSITIPNSVTSIESQTFEGCKNLTNITIPNSVTSIEDFAFEGCTSLTSITIPNNVTSIEYQVFRYCKSLTSITIPGSVTSIKSQAFEKCESLTSITIPNSVTSIEDSAFEGCTSLTSITIPNSVTSIEDSAFRDCTSLTNITIPNSVTSIGEAAFYDCTSLTNITIPNSVTSIGDEAFWDCTSLTNITIPNSVTSIGDEAFRDCTSLTNITIPNSVTSIGGYAFNSCKNLKDITIPGNVTSIGNNAFSNCNSLVANVYKNSAGLTYCKNNKIDYRIVGSYDKKHYIQIENGTCTNIDESTELKVNQLKEGNDYDVVSKSFDNFELYDLSFYKDDQKVTIDGTAIVRIPVKEGMDGSKCKVYYNDNGTFTDMGAVYKDGYMEFETNHFSQYVVAEIESSTFTLGDVNEDDKVDFLDAIVVLRHDAEIIQLTDNQMKAAEVNKDSKVDFLDAIMILRYDAEIINGFN